MSVYYVPSLKPVQYADFVALCNDRIAETFEDWQVAQSLMRRDLVARGHHVVGVDVGPGDLRRYCRAMSRRADAAALSALAAQIGRDRFEPGESDERARAGTVIVENSAEQRAIFEDNRADESPIPRKRHWWSGWRRPKFLRWLDRRRPLATS